MSDFIKKIEGTVDLDQIRSDLQRMLSMTSWESNNQIGLRHRINASDQWKDCTGWIYDTVAKKTLAVESDFDQWNDQCPDYTRGVLKNLSSTLGVKWGRVRFMRLMPKTGLTMHKDDGYRYHLAIDTNLNAIFGECFEKSSIRSICYHLPSDGHWYRVHTAKEHFVFNGGWTPRIHLVACSI
jgi:hypothetical protein